MDACMPPLHMHPHDLIPDINGRTTGDQSQRVTVSECNNVNKHMHVNRHNIQRMHGSHERRGAHAAPASTMLTSTCTLIVITYSACKVVTKGEARTLSGLGVWQRRMRRGMSMVQRSGRTRLCVRSIEQLDSHAARSPAVTAFQMAACLSCISSITSPALPTDPRLVEITQRMRPCKLHYNTRASCLTSQNAQLQASQEKLFVPTVQVL